MHRAGSELPYFHSTPEYASLEAVQFGAGTGGQFDLPLADAYSVGVTLYELLTGALPVTLTEAAEAEAGAAGNSLLAWESALCGGCVVEKHRCPCSCVMS